MNEEDAEKIIGIKAHGADVLGGQVGSEGYEQGAREMASAFDLKTVAIPLRESFSADYNGWSAMLHDGKIFNSKSYRLQIVDRVGGGDSFAGGLIYALASGQLA